MLVPVRQLYPVRLEFPNDTRSETIETNLPVSPLLHPKIFFHNTSTTDTFSVVLSQVLNLGVNDDPLISGTFPVVMVNADVGPGELLWHVFPATYLGEGNISHTVTLSITGASADVILHMWVEGQFEESLRVLPSFEPIVI